VRGLPASLDPSRKPDGTWQKGVSGNAGAKPGRVLAMIRQFASSHDLINDILLQRASEAVGIHISEIPIEARQTPLTLLTWVMYVRAAAGDIDFFREVMDRLAPKPPKTAVAVQVNNGRTSVVSAGAEASVKEAADDYYENLTPPAEE
jgi:hypothetical protein